MGHARLEFTLIAAKSSDGYDLQLSGASRGGFREIPTSAGSREALRDLGLKHRSEQILV